RKAPRAAFAPRLAETVKPRLPEFLMTITPSMRARRLRVSSVDPLSTTITSVAVSVCRARARRHESVRSARFHTTTTTETTGTAGVVSPSRDPAARKLARNARDVRASASVAVTSRTGRAAGELGRFDQA